MADVILFHHALGLTDGVIEFADNLRAAGHRVTLPDLFDGKTFDTIDAGVAHAQSIGFDEIIRRGERAAENMPAATVFAGFSLGVLPAQKLAQTRPGALGAILYFGGIPATHFAPSWPADVALQLHMIEHDKWGDCDDVRQLAADVKGSEFFIYPGHGHLIADRSSSDYDPAAAELILQRTIEFLNAFN